MCIPVRWAGSASSASAPSTAWCPGCGSANALYSLQLVEWHFWTATIGIVFYITSMWVAGIMQGLMWRAYNDYGFLEYSFVETVQAMHPYYVIRAHWRRALLRRHFDHDLQHLAHDPRRCPRSGADRGTGLRAGRARPRRKERPMFEKHDIIERNSMLLLIGILVVVAIGGIVEIAPLFWVQATIEKVQGMRPYTPLELEGRDIYVREGCYLCHSQMIRTLRDEVERYGHYSLAAESMYDHPFQWGSKRTGPDLARVGGKYSDEWQRAHLADPRSVVPESVMPPYVFLEKTPLDYRDIALQLKANRDVGVPYTDADIENARRTWKPRLIRTATMSRACRRAMAARSMCATSTAIPRQSPKPMR